MGDDEDRNAILERRRRLLASALSGVAMGTLALVSEACCLSMECSPEACGEDAGTQFDSGALRDSGPPDAGIDSRSDAGSDAAADAGSDAAVDASLDAAVDAAADDAAVDAG